MESKKVQTTQVQTEIWMIKSMRYQKPQRKRSLMIHPKYEQSSQCREKCSINTTALMLRFNYGNDTRILWGGVDEDLQLVNSVIVSTRYFRIISLQSVFRNSNVGTPEKDAFTQT